MKVNLTADQLLAQMAQMRKAALGDAIANPAEQVAKTTQQKDFGDVLVNAVNKVNQYQAESAKLAQQIETGDGGVSLVKAMIASQKANVAFQATVQVRNRLVSAYQDIMNMPI